MGDAYRRVGSVDALAAGARGAVGIDAQVRLLDVDVDVVCLGKNGDGSRRGLDAALALCLGDALDAVNAGLVLHDRVDLVAGHLELNGLEATGLGRAAGQDLDLPALGRGKALVHLKEVAGKDGSLVAARGTADLDDGVLVVVGVGRDQQDLDVVLEGGELLLVCRDVLLQHGLLVCIRGFAQHLFGGVDVVEGAKVLAGLLDKLGLACVLFGQAGVLFGVGRHGRVHELCFKLLVGRNDLL